MKLEIDRLTWARGGMNGTSLLLNVDGNMCCLGFAAIECGLKAEDILGFGAWEEMSNDLIPQLEGMEDNVYSEVFNNDDYVGIQNTPFHESAVEINDYDIIKAQATREANPENDFMPMMFTDEGTREDTLTKLFKDEGIALTFIN